MLTLNIVGNLFAIVGIAAAVLIFVLISLFIKWYKKPALGTAIIRTGSDGAKVCFEKGIFIIPILHRYELIDITMKTFTVDHTGDNVIVLDNGVKVEVKVLFFIRIANNYEDVVKVATTIGSERASKKETLKELFHIKLSETIKEVAYNLGVQSNDKPRFREEILISIGSNLQGFTLDDCAIEQLKVIETSMFEKKN